MHCFRIAALVLWAASGWAQAVVTRPLLPEMALAERDGVPATVHTRFGIGSGLMFDADKVLAARHTVLLPGGAMAGEIGVSFARPPLNNIMESRTAVIAEDKPHDLVLLRLVDDAAAATSQAEPVPLKQCEPAAQAHVAAAPRRPQRRTPKRPRENARLLEAKAVASPPVRLRIVWDGPLAKRR